MSHANDFVILGFSKTVLSYYIANLHQYYSARGYFIWPICQTMNKNVKNWLTDYCFVTREIYKTMSLGNTGHCEETVANAFFLEYFVVYLSVP